MRRNLGLTVFPASVGGEGEQEPPPEGAQAASVPMGFDDGHIVAKAEKVTLSTVTGAEVTSDYLQVLPTGHLQITDKAAFYAALPVTVPVTLSGTGGSGEEIINVALTSMPGYYDVELLKANMAVHYDVGSNLGRATDSDSDFIYDIVDRGNLELYVWNPWFADRRPALVPSLMNPARKAFDSIPPASSGATYGLFMAQENTDILNSKWHGPRYIRFNGNDNQLQVTSDLEPQNDQTRLTFTGGQLLAQTILLVIAWDESGNLVTRLNGIEIERKTPALYISGSGAVNISIASPAVFSRTNHDFNPDQPVSFTTTGSLPTGITPGARYYVLETGLSDNAFQVSATPGGAAVNTSGSQSGTHTVNRIWIPPANPGVLAFVGYARTSNALKNGTIISHTAFGQHPWWEGATWDGHIGEYVEFLNTTGQI